MLYIGKHKPKTFAERFETGVNSPEKVLGKTNTHIIRAVSDPARRGTVKNMAISGI